jgi:hypothetical protein
MTIGKGEPYSYIIINPSIRSFESRNPDALFSRAKSAGNDTSPPDCAWHSSVLVNEDRLCHKMNTPTVLACYLSNDIFMELKLINVILIKHIKSNILPIKHI